MMQAGHILMICHTENNVVSSFYTCILALRYCIESIMGCGVCQKCTNTTCLYLANWRHAYANLHAQYNHPTKCINQHAIMQYAGMQYVNANMQYAGMQYIWQCKHATYWHAVCQHAVYQCKHVVCQCKHAVCQCKHAICRHASMSTYSMQWLNMCLPTCSKQDINIQKKQCVFT